MGIIMEDIDYILKELQKKIKESDGVRICLDQNSNNFENWVQIELCQILKTRLPAQHRLIVEKDNIVITIGVERDGNFEKKVVIEIKIIRVGGAGRTIEKVKKDIDKLVASSGNEKVFLCVVYTDSSKNIEEHWEKGSIHKNGYKGVIEEYIKLRIGPKKFKRLPFSGDLVKNRISLDCFIF